MKLNFIVLYFIFFLVIGYVLSSIYRPFIYNNNIDDFGLADVGNNIALVPSVYFMILLSRKKPFYGFYKDIFFYTSFLIIIEILSKNIKSIGAFDYKANIGLLFGAFLTFYIVKSHILK